MLKYTIYVVLVRPGLSLGTVNFDRISSLPTDLKYVVVPKQLLVNLLSKLKFMVLLERL